MGGVYCLNGPCAGHPPCVGKRKNSSEKERIVGILEEMSKAYNKCLISGSSLPAEYAEAASVYASFLEAKEEKKRESARKRKAEEERPGSMEAVETVMNLRPPALRLSEEHFLPCPPFPPRHRICPRIIFQHRVLAHHLLVSHRVLARGLRLLLLPPLGLPLPLNFVLLMQTQVQSSNVAWVVF